MLHPRDFLEQDFFIYVSSLEQLEEVKRYYCEAYDYCSRSKSTVHATNFENFPYLFTRRIGDGIHGYSKRYGEDTEKGIPFEAWLDMISYTEPEYELEESDHDISFLME